MQKKYDNQFEIGKNNIGRYKSERDDARKETEAIRAESKEKLSEIVELQDRLIDLEK